MSLKIVSGGQTGADQAGWIAAQRSGLPTGGWMPKGWLTEDGPRSSFGRLYGAVEHSGGYKERTVANVHDSDGTLWFGDPDSRGGKATLLACRAMNRPTLIVSDESVRASAVVGWIVANYIRTLNVAGNRESGQPGIGERVERFLMAVFARLDD